MTDEADKWLSKCDPERWLLEEYKLLASQYFHEDTQFKNVLKMFATIHIALFAFVTSEFVGDNPFSPFAIAIVGILLSIAWFGSLVRVREFRNFFPNRIREVEKAIHTAWENAGVTSPAGFSPLDLRTSEGWETAREGESFIYRYFRRFETGQMYLVLPVCSLAVWVAVIIWHLYWPAEVGSLS